MSASRALTADEEESTGTTPRTRGNPGSLPVCGWATGAAAAVPAPSTTSAPASARPATLLRRLEVFPQLPRLTEVDVLGLG